MTTRHPKTGDRIGPRAQQHWDWRAASNFIGGGAGGGLLLFAAAAHLAGADVAPLIIAGMVLIAAGLFCVWLEIGRPLRALNVYRHLATSWMTREAAVAPLLFATGVAAAATGHSVLIVLAGLLGAAFAYSQARILSADKGIPAWRHPGCRPFVVATGLTEGAGLLALASPLLPTTNAVFGVAVLLLLCLLARVLAWRNYLGGLKRDGVPEGSVRALTAIDRRFVVYGHAVPAGLSLAAALVVPLAAFAAPLAGVLAVGAGWFAKYTLVRRAAWTQGFALKHLPVRGQPARAVGAR